MSKAIKLFLIVAAGLLLFAWIFYNYNMTAPPNRHAAPVEFIIEPGWGVNRISRELFSRDLIRSKFYFEVYVWFKGWESNFQSGSHTVSSAMNIKEIVRSMIKGVGRENTITVIEGWSNRQIADYLAESGVVSAENFLTVVDGGPTLAGEYDFLNDKPDNVGLAGYLFPDTYRIFAKTAAGDIVKKMLDNFDQKLDVSLRAEIQDQGKTIFETVTLASIIEKEVRSAEDMKLVADVFYKRLKAGMALQSDATVNFVTGQDDIQPTIKDTEIDNPYNTYKYRGLPPGPISNPGLNALTAAIEPTPNPYYYFLTTKDTGEVIYAQTYAEHLANKAKYLD